MPSFFLRMIRACLAYSSTIVHEAFVRGVVLFSYAQAKSFGVVALHVEWWNSGCQVVIFGVTLIFCCRVTCYGAGSFVGLKTENAPIMPYLIFFLHHAVGVCRSCTCRCSRTVVFLSHALIFCCGLHLFYTPRGILLIACEFIRTARGSAVHYSMSRRCCSVESSVLLKLPLLLENCPR